MSEEKRWADIEDPREQCEAMLGHKLEHWQWDWIQHYAQGERLVRDHTKRHPTYKWSHKARSYAELTEADYIWAYNYNAFVNEARL